ncbi:MAG: putative porin [Kiritimatiellae bacterium]|nr:putative porin [Kiritimatiellia bacterium]
MNRMTTALLMAGILGGAYVGHAQDEEQGVDISGDIRLRHEYVDQDDKSSDRHRQRLRARVNLNADVNENVKAGIRVASGSDDPVSTNQSFDDSFSSKDLRLDKAYLAWRVAEALELTGGKMGAPWLRVADLVWDSDLNPEGLAAVFEHAIEGVTFMANGGCFWLDEISSTSDDRMLYTGQVALESKLGEAAKVLVGAGVYHYDNMQGLALLVDSEDSFGNATADTGTEEEPSLVYAEDFEIYELFAQISGFAGDIPVKAYGQLVSNDAASNDDTGYLVGLTVGKAKEPGTYEFGYNYRDIEKNAVVAAFNDSDFGGGTNAEGHKLKAKVALDKSWTAGATVFLNQLDPDGKDVDYTRVQIDLVAKF